MTIINKSENIGNGDLYRMTIGKNSVRMSDEIDEQFTVRHWVCYEDVRKDTGEVIKLLSLMDEGNEIFRTTSPTFIEDFLNIVEFFGSENLEIGVSQGTSKKGRNFLSCDYRGK